MTFIFIIIRVNCILVRLNLLLTSYPCARRMRLELETAERKAKLQMELIDNNRYFLTMYDEDVEFLFLFDVFGLLF